MEDGLKQFLREKGVTTDDALLGFHLPPFITVNHLHMHAIAPRSQMGFLSKLIFLPSAWFKTVSYIIYSFAKLILSLYLQADNARLYLSAKET